MITGHTYVLRFVSQHVSTLWGPAGPLRVDTLPNEESDALVDSFKDLSSKLFKEKRRRIKLRFTSKPTVNKSNELASRDASARRAELESLSGVFCTPKAPQTTRKTKYKSRKWGTMMPRTLYSLLPASLSPTTTKDDDDDDDEGSDTENRDVKTDPRSKSSASFVKKIPRGTRVTAELQRGVVKKGYVRYWGRTEFYSGEWVGVELEEPAGKNDGSVQGVEYFTCPDRHGIFVRPHVVSILIDKEHPSAQSSPLKERTRKGLRRRLV